MPPKVKVTKEDIVQTAVTIVRGSGAEALSARLVATILGCSTQPVFSNFATMEELRLAVVERADVLCNEYIKREIECGEFPPYKASGMAYIRFAMEEKELFRLLYMRDRTGENADEEGAVSQQMEGLVHRTIGLDSDTERLFHLEMWAYVHGIATMVATGYTDLPRDLISRMITDVYRGLRKQYGME